MVWCDQLRHKLAAMLVQMVDARQAQQTKPVEERLAMARKHLLNEQPVTVQDTSAIKFRSHIQFSPPFSAAIRFIASSPDIIMQACQGAECQYHKIPDLEVLPSSYTDRKTTNQDLSMYIGEIHPAVFAGATSLSLGPVEGEKGFIVAAEREKDVEVLSDVSLLCKTFAIGCA